jgi:hypothetical protein
VQLSEECRAEDFEAATSATRRDDSPHLCDNDVPAVWATGGGTQEGLLMAVAARTTAAALSVAGDDFFPSSVSAHFLTASRPGPATLRTEAIRRGSRLTTAQVSLLQTDKDGNQSEKLRALVTYGRFSTGHIVSPRRPRVFRAPTRV